MQNNNEIFVKTSNNFEMKVLFDILSEISSETDIVNCILLCYFV
jgi:hypothetical protein